MPLLETFGAYTNNVLGSLVGTPEGFYDSSGATSRGFATLGAFSLLAVLLFLVIVLANCYGAARLSWCYNTFYGLGQTEKILWSILCFFYSAVYYPVYAIFLDPVCGRVAQKNGRRV